MRKNITILAIVLQVSLFSFYASAEPTQCSFLALEFSGNEDPTLGMQIVSDEGEYFTMSYTGADGYYAFTYSYNRKLAKNNPKKFFEVMGKINALMNEDSDSMKFVCRK